MWTLRGAPMAFIRSTLNWLRPFVMAANLCCASLAMAQMPSPGPGRIVGAVDGIGRDGDQLFVAGWACQQRQKQSIAVRIFAGPSRSGFLTAGMANLPSEPAVARACQDQDSGEHRFFIVLPIGYSRSGTLEVEGFIIGGAERATLAGSGKSLTLHGGLAAPFPPPTPPRLPGAYRSLAEHPRVFVTATELKDAASRANRPGSYSSERFNRLVGDVTRDLASGIDWDATYAGCIGDIYQYAFSFEPQNGKDATIRAALRVAPNAKTPAGGAIVASRLALYAALARAGAIPPAGAPSIDQASALAKRILLAWAERGFPRDAHGRFLLLPALSCEENGKVSLLGAEAPALALGRGFTYSVHAQDLLQYLGALNADETRRLDAFHGAMFDVIRQSENFKFGNGAIPFPAPPIARFNNVDAGALASLLAIARLQDDPRRFNAVLYGGDASTPVLLPWWRFFNRAIYGESDSPLQCSVGAVACAHNAKDPDKYPYFQTAIVFPGEIVDRHRNEHTLNSFGYSMGLLRSLIDAAEILRISGFDPFGYRGARQQSIEQAILYYSCFGKAAGYGKTVTPENASACPNAEQYYGKIVNDVARVVVYGAYRFADDHAITALDETAKAASKSIPLDPLVFGRWRD
jgi:hypothetical protein